MRYAVIGTGWIADSYVQGAARSGNWELAAVCSRSRETGLAFGGKYGVSAVCTSPEELAADPSIPAVYIASPNCCHYEQSRMMLEAGKHVLCEKPVTVTPEGCRDLQELAEKRGLVYLEAIIMLHQPHLAAVESAIARLGRIRAARLSFDQLSSKYPAYLRGELPNIFNPKMATGSLMDLGIYCVYPAVAWFGVPDRIEAAASFLPSGADAACSAIFGYPDKLVTLDCCKTGQSCLGSEILGDEGTLEIRSISQLIGVVLHRKDGGCETIVGEAEKAALMGNEAADFYRYIAGPASSREQYRRDSRLALEVSRAMAEIRARAGIRFEGEFR